MKRMRYLVLATVAVVTIYALFFDNKPQRQEPAKEAEAGVVCDTAASSCVRDTAVQAASSCFSPSDHARRIVERNSWGKAPDWSVGELLYELHEVYQIMQAYERGDGIDTARVMALERKLNYLVDNDIANKNKQNQ